MTSRLVLTSPGVPSASFWPKFRTTMRSQVPMTAFMLCSTSRIVVPWPRIVLIRSITRPLSCRFMPVTGSASRRGRGPRDAEHALVTVRQVLRQVIGMRRQPRELERLAAARDLVRRKIPPAEQELPEPGAAVQVHAQPALPEGRQLL